MITKIGINIHCKTAKNQHKFLSEMNSQEYYKRPFHYWEFQSILDKYLKDCNRCNWDIDVEHNFQNDDSVLNSIIFEINNMCGFDKTKLKQELTEYITNKFNF